MDEKLIVSEELAAQGTPIQSQANDWESVINELARLNKFSLDPQENNRRSSKWLSVPQNKRAAYLRAARPKMQPEVFEALFAVSNPVALDIAVEEEKQDARQKAGIEAGSFTDIYLPEYASLLEREQLTGEEESTLKKGLAMASGALSAPGTAIFGRPQPTDDVVSGTFKTLATDPMLPIGVLTGGASMALPRAATRVGALLRGAGIGMGEGVADAALQYGREELTPGSAALGVLGGGVLGAGGAALERGLTAPLQTRKAKFAPRTDEIELPSVESPAFGKQAVKRQEELAKSYAPIGVDPQRFADLDDELRGIVIRASEDPADAEFFRDMLDLSQKYVASAKKRQFNPFVKLADTKGTEALDKFTADLQALGKKIQFFRDEYKDKVAGVSVQELADRLDFGGSKLKVDIDEKGKRDVYFVRPNGRRIDKPSKAQSEFIAEFGNVDVVDGDDVLFLRDKLKKQVYKRGGGKNYNVDPEIEGLYSDLNSAFDGLLVEYTQNPRLVDAFQADRKRFAVKMAEAAELDKAFGRKVDRETGKVIDDEADPIFDSETPDDELFESVRTKLSQRLKTMSKNPENWDDVGEILRKNTGIDVLKYADLTRGAAEIAGVPQSRSLLKSQEASGAAAAKAIRPEVASVLEKAQQMFKPTDRETVFQMLAQAQGREAALPWYEKPYVAEGLSTLGRGGQAANLALQQPFFGGLQYLTQERGEQ